MSTEQDARKVHVKRVTIDGVERLVTVLPPGPVIEDDVVWRERKRPSDATFTYDGPANTILDYVLARSDNNFL